MIDASVRSCPHPAVIGRYGRNGKAQVCWLICRKCQFGEKGKYDGGIKCTYEKEKEK